MDRLERLELILERSRATHDELVALRKALPWWHVWGRLTLWIDALWEADLISETITELSLERMRRR